MAMRRRFRSGVDVLYALRLVCAGRRCLNLCGAMELRGGNVRYEVLKLCAAFVKPYRLRCTTDAVAMRKVQLAQTYGAFGTIREMCMVLEGAEPRPEQSPDDQLLTLKGYHPISPSPVDTC
jgi:hypothetical protein